MTTREFTPRLDRQITRIVKGASPGLNPLGNPLPPTSETEVKLWARTEVTSPGGTSPRWCRADLSPSATRGISCGLNPAPGAAKDSFKDEERRDMLTVQGVEQIGRGYLELLARSGGI